MKNIWVNLRMFLWMTVLTGLIYPLFVTAIAQLTMKRQADGGLIKFQENVIGATLVGQKFESDRYFWGRPSAIGYDPLPSGGSNLGPTSAELKSQVEERREKILKVHLDKNENIPSELLFSSGSGIDPHISLSTAYFQLERVAKARGLRNEDIVQLIDRMTIKRLFQFLGEGYINVLLVNHALDHEQ